MTVRHLNSKTALHLSMQLQIPLSALQQPLLTVKRSHLGKSSMQIAVSLCLRHNLTSLRLQATCTSLGHFLKAFQTCPPGLLTMPLSALSQQSSSKVTPLVHPVVLSSGMQVMSCSHRALIITAPLTRAGQLLKALQLSSRLVCPLVGPTAVSRELLAALPSIGLTVSRALLAALPSQSMQPSPYSPTHAQSRALPAALLSQTLQQPRDRNSLSRAQLSSGPVPSRALHTALLAQLLQPP